MTTTVHNVAEYILSKKGSMSAMKLQKLCYYSHAWHLVWEERPLFGERIEAWGNGPVIPALYAKHRGQFTVSPGGFGGDPDALDAGEVESVDAALDHYGDWRAHELSELTHSERPWIDARVGLGPGERGDRQITDSAMAGFYDSLTVTEAERVGGSAKTSQ